MQQQELMVVLVDQIHDVILLIILQNLHDQFQDHDDNHFANILDNSIRVIILENYVYEGNER